MARDIRPHIYTLGTSPRLVLETVDIDGLPITPTEARISIEKPDGTVFTVSGGLMTQVGDNLTYEYSPLTEGWYMYEGWIKSADGREASQTKGFYVTDSVGE